MNQHMAKEIARRLYSKALRIVLPILKYQNTHNLIREYDKQYGKGNYIILNPPQGLGDILACCCGIEYLDVESKKVIVLVGKKYFTDIRSFFPPDYVEIAFTKKRFSDNPYKCYIPLNHKMYVSDQPFISMKYNICQALGISPEVIFHNQYKKKESFCGLPPIKAKKTVYISPFATSCKEELSFDFWDNLAQKLVEKGYDVIFNAPSDSHYSKCYMTCLQNLEDTVELVTRCGFFIGWRSGLCDIIGMYAEAKMVVVYPSNPHKIQSLVIPSGLSYSEAYKECCSLRSLWGTEALEIINNPNIFCQIEKEFHNVR